MRSDDVIAMWWFHRIKQSPKEMGWRAESILAVKCLVHNIDCRSRSGFLSVTTILFVDCMRTMHDKDSCAMAVKVLWIIKTLQCFICPLYG